jgi:hypothetical protein
MASLREDDVAGGLGLASGTPLAGAVERGGEPWPSGTFTGVLPGVVSGVVGLSSLESAFIPNTPLRNGIKQFYAA